MTMNSRTFRFSYGDLEIDLGEIERVLGYGEGSDRDIVNAVVEEILSEKDIFNSIKAQYTLFTDIGFSDPDKTLRVGPVIFNINKTIYSRIRKSDTIAVFLCTAGEEIGIRTRKYLSEGDPLTGYITDMLGSLITNAAANLVEEELERETAREGKKISNRYSPGYCGWMTAEQHKLFSLVPGNFCGIRLTESALMEPVKSMSGIIGIGMKVRYSQYSCSLCDMPNCPYRETGGKKGS